MEQNYLLISNIMDKVDKDSIPLLKKELSNLNEEQTVSLACTQLYNPTTVILLSFFLGGYGVDRFWIKDKKIGFAKLFANILNILFLLTTSFILISTKSINDNGLIILTILSSFIAICLSIWFIVDIFYCYKRARKKNVILVLNAIGKGDLVKDLK